MYVMIPMERCPSTGNYWYIIFHSQTNYKLYGHRAATNNYFHLRLICPIFLRLIVYSVKCQKVLKMLILISQSSM